MLPDQMSQWQLFSNQLCLESACSNFSFLACRVVAEKFVVGGLGLVVVVQTSFRVQL